MMQLLLEEDKMSMPAGVVVYQQLANIKQVDVALAEVPVVLKRDCPPKRF